MPLRGAFLLGAAILASCSTPPTSPPPQPSEAGRDSVPESPPSFPFLDAKLDRLDQPVVDRTAPEAGASCPDLHPNDTCSAALPLPDAVAGKGWTSVMASTIGAGDLDWFKVSAERLDPCAPLPLEQCLILTVRMIVPAGRKLRLCAQEKDCGAVPKCVESQTLGAAHELVVGIEHKSLCPPFPPFAQATALVSIGCLDGKGECATYSLASKFEPCP